MVSTSGTLYIGITNNLERRVWEHQHDLIPGFTKKYQCHKLVYCEHSQDVNAAIAREKQLKRWRRSKKIELIEKENSPWQDLSKDWY